MLPKKAKSEARDREREEEPERREQGRRAQERVLREYGNVAYARKLLAFMEEK